MEAALRNIKQSSSRKFLPSETCALRAAEEKYATARETEFVSMIASSMSKAPMFAGWQLEQLEALVPMASFHTTISNCGDRLHFQYSNESNILLCNLKSNKFDNHRKYCYEEYVRQANQSKYTVLLLLDGLLTVSINNSSKKLTKGQTACFTHCGQSESAPFSNELPSPEKRFSDVEWLKVQDISYFSQHSFFMLLSQAAIQCVAQTPKFGSKVEFSLHGDTTIMSQGISLDAICQAANRKITLYRPGEVCAEAHADGKVSIIVCGRCSMTHGENIEAQLHNTCNIRHIAQMTKLSVSQTLYFGIKRRRTASIDSLHCKNKTVTGDGLHSGMEAKKIHPIQPTIATDVGANAETEMHFELLRVAGEKHEASAYNSAKSDRCFMNPFIAKLPAVSPSHPSSQEEGTLPQSPVQKKRGMLAKNLDNIDVMPKNSGPTSSPDLDDDLDSIFSTNQLTEQSTFWGYTPDLQMPLSKAKFNWALIRLFVYSCKKKVQDLFGRGQFLDVSNLVRVQESWRKGHLSWKFSALSVVCTLPCEEALATFNPILHSISRVASWHQDLNEQPHFRSATNVEKLLVGTRFLRGISTIPESTRRILLKCCSFEVWPPGALMLSTVASRERMCFVIDGDAAAFSTLQKDSLNAIKNNEDVAYRYIPGDVLSHDNINLSFANEPQKAEHVYAGLAGAKILSIPHTAQEKLMKPLWDLEMNVRKRCFEASLLSAAFSESALVKFLSQCRAVELVGDETELKLSDNCIYFVLKGFVRVRGSVPLTIDHIAGKGRMKDNFSKCGGINSMVDSFSLPSKLENRLKRKLAASPKKSHSHLKFNVADIYPPHLFRFCSHDCDRKCHPTSCWKFASYSCTSETKLLEVKLECWPQKNLHEILKASDTARTRLWNHFLQVKSFSLPHLDTSSGHPAISLDLEKTEFKCKPFAKTRIDKLAVPFERFQTAQKACDFTIYSQVDAYQEVVDTAADLKAIQAARLELSTVENLKLNRLSAQPSESRHGHQPTASSKPLELNSFLYDVAAIACPHVLYKEHTELRSISSQPRTSSLNLWNRTLNQMTVSVVEPSRRVLFLADKEDSINKLTLEEDDEFEEFCSILKEQSQNPVIRDSRKNRKFLANFGDGMVKSKAFIKAKWCFDLP